jgi:hypothetical protein
MELIRGKLRSMYLLSSSKLIAHGFSGEQVTSGIDLTLAFIEAKYPNGSTLANDISHTMEHQRITDWRHDPEAEYFHVPPTN